MFGILFNALSIILGKMIAASLTEKFLMRLILVFGDWLVKSTKNDLAEEIWKDYKSALKTKIGI